MSSSARQTNSSQSNLQSGKVYKKISDFLANNPTLDLDPKPIKSANTITNPYTNKKKRRYIDTIGNSLPPSLSNTVMGQCYHKLRRLENDLNISLSKRHSFIADQLEQQRESRVTRILRLELFNTFHLNPKNKLKNKWVFKVQTKLFNPKNMSEPITFEKNALESLYYNPLQSIISRLVFEFDAKNGHKMERIEWNNDSDSNAEIMNGIEIAREGNENCEMNIFVSLKHWGIPLRNGNNKNQNHQSLWEMSEDLSNILGLGLLSNSSGNTQKTKKRYHSKAEILQCLSVYIRSKGLLRSDNSMAIDCDKALHSLIGAHTIYSANLWKLLLLKKQIWRAKPIHFRHSIAVQGKIEKNAKFYDILVKVPSLIALKAKEANKYALMTDSLNIQISDVIEEICDQSKESEMYNQYANDPVCAMDVIVANQRENLQIIKELAQNASVKPSEYFANSAVYKDIKRYLKKRQIYENNNKTNK